MAEASLVGTPSQARFHFSLTINCARCPLRPRKVVTGGDSEAGPPLQPQCFPNPEALVRFRARVQTNKATVDATIVRAAICCQSMKQSLIHDPDLAIPSLTFRPQNLPAAGDPVTRQA